MRPPRILQTRRIGEDLMAWELILWLFAFAAVISLIGMTAYQLICLSDLEFDYINPYDSSSRINAVVIPEFAVQGVLCTSFLLTWHLFPFLIMAPITYYHVKLFTDGKHLIDVTEIFRLINGEKKYRMIKLAFYFGLFIMVIYRLILSAVLTVDKDTNLLESRLL
ncbi:protein cornichon homolog 2-like [Typha latifolia]|uniref:protein cornichon homolog 2-like n=1 Tax=Typha latifolia TaxID=4733 RepID=UPI003C301868